MKNIKYIISLAFVIGFVIFQSCEKENNSLITPFYTEYNDYYVASSYDVENGATYEIIDNIDTLNAILSPKEYTSNPDLFTESDLENNIVIAVIKQYSNVCGVRMSLDSVLFNDDKIQIYYSNNVSYGDGLSGGYTCNVFAQPNLVILTNKTDYSIIDFFENRMLIETIAN